MRFIMKTTKRRVLKESASTIEVAIAKCLSQAKLHPSELDEIVSLTSEELISEHNLDYLLAEKVRVHVQTEVQRHTQQGLMTYQTQSREEYGSMTRTHPIPESKENKKNVIKELSDFDLEDITVIDDEESHLPKPDHADKDKGDGRMLDYGHVKSDSREGKMARQALYEMSVYSKELHDLLKDDDDLPQWCHYKIAVARACVGKVKHYLEYKIKQHTGEIQ